MQKLQAIINAQKAKPKIINNKEKIEDQKKKYQLQQQQFKRIEKANLQKKEKEMHEFYDKKRKLIKPNEFQQKLIPISKQQIFTRLRGINEPVTYFAEDDWERYQRMVRQQSNRQKYPDWHNKAQDEEFQRKLKESEEYERIDGLLRPRLIEPRLMDDGNLRAKKLKMIHEEKGERDFDGICDEIFLWLSKVLRDWNEVLNQKYHSAEEKAMAKVNFERYAESEYDLKSFLEVLKKRGGDKEMVRSVYNIMNCCLVREYVFANDKYIELSIGTAPWPMGVAMLGITVKRNALRLSHVLNEEMTRRWMQAIKRIITVSQQLYPNQDALKMVGYSVTKTV